VGGKSAALLAGLLLALVPACAAEDDSPEAQVRRLFDEFERASREKDLKALKSFISESYRDSAGRDKRALTGIMTGYYLRRGSVYVLLRIQELELPEPGSARAELLAAMARTPLLDWNEMPRVKADAYVFDVGLADEGNGEWRVVDAAWRPATADDLYL
jgi:hypothetical protein